jgi:phosphoribosyl 1,2-cyclic phosphodiesterase
MTFELTFWGTRGSIPSPGPGTVRYGGNTPCIEVRTRSGQLIILDAGTGIRDLGRALTAAPAAAEHRGIVADIYLTHAHWDHIQGIPFFAPLFHAGNRFTICGPVGDTGVPGSIGATIDRVLRDQMSDVVFPVRFDELLAEVGFCDMSTGSRSGIGYSAAAFPVRHPGGALAYRFSGSGGGSTSFVYISDNELGAGGNARRASPATLGDDWRERLVAFVRGARMLVHDASYTDEEYEQHRGWGHSTFHDAVDLALEADVQELVLFHHKPERTDEELDRCTADCRAFVERRGGSLTITAAAEGMTLTV